MAAWRQRVDRACATLVSFPVLSRLTGWLADLRLPAPLAGRLIRAYARIYKVDLAEAAEPVEAYRSFNAFFTRRLRDGARPIDARPGVVASPSDSLLCHTGTVPPDGRVGPVKGQDFEIGALLGSSEEADPYRAAHHATLYLSPGMYHRVHAPVDGHIVSWRYLPGRLFPVNPPAARSVPGLLARNERVAVHLETEDLGPVAVVLVGAANVGRITLRFADLKTNAGASAERSRPPRPLPVRRGEEIGVFNLGSTVVLLAAHPALRVAGATAGALVRVGEALWLRG